MYRLGESPSSTARPSSCSVHLCQHYWDGAVYSYNHGATTTTMSTEIATPSSGTVYGDEYYVLLSAWDTADNYDQIGIASVNGVAGGIASPDWVVIYTTPYNSCNTSPSGNLITSAYLTPSTLYTFAATLSGTHLSYKVTDSQGTFWASPSWTDAASGFVASTEYKCSGGQGPYLSLTAYEEVYQLKNQNFPQFDFEFYHTTLGGTIISSSAAWEQDVQYLPAQSNYNYDTDFGTSNVRIANEPEWMAFPADSYSLTPGGGFTDQGYDVGITDYCGGTTCPFSLICSAPSTGSWSYSYAPAQYLQTWYIQTNTSGTQTEIFYNLTSSSLDSPGTYYGSCQDQLSPGYVSTFVWYVTLT